QPGEARVLAALAEGAEHDGAELLQRLREVALEVTHEMLALAGTGLVAAELDGLEVSQVLHGIHGRVPSLGVGGGVRAGAQEAGQRGPGQQVSHMGSPVQMLGPRCRAASASSMRMIWLVQLVSQVLPPSVE